ncbi:MAG: Rrf2 family transcriptional regulator [Actinobacteria bacterium]|nr:MAG: Rrf2 family transcriptional regulator [Actinomycetota bacterium]
MQITRKSEYAVRVILYLSAKKGSKVLARQISEEMDIPKQFLAQIMLSLNRAGYVTAIRGSNGGFLLAMDPSQIAVSDVIEAIEGKVAINKCMMADSDCQNYSVCPIHDVWTEAQEKMLKVLAKANFASLVRKAKTKTKQVKSEDIKSPFYQSL